MLNIILKVGHVNAINSTMQNHLSIQSIDLTGIYRESAMIMSIEIGNVIRLQENGTS